MNFKMLGKSELKVSTICFGCWALGGKGWGTDVDDQQSILAIRRAIDLGINFFDTADVYGNGKSEEILGKALGGAYRDVMVATKVGNRFDKDGRIYGDLSKDHILWSIDESLKRLDREVIDLYQVHRPDDGTPIRETMDALMACIEAGKVRYIGLSNQTVEQISEYMSYGTVVSLQPPLNLLYRYAEIELLPFCLQNDIGVIPYSPMARGLLTGKYREKVTFPENDFRGAYFLFGEGAFERNIQSVMALEQYAQDLSITMSQLAIAWILAHPAVTSAIVGAKRPKQIEETASAYDIKLDQDALKKIERILMSGTYY